MTIIGLCGSKSAGKDTMADILISTENYIKVAFADFIKHALIPLFGWDENIFDQDKKELEDPYWGVTPRKMCQQLGTEFLRVQCNDLISKKFLLPNGEEYESTFHIKRINQDIVNFLKINKNTNIVFSDIRFQDELDYVKKLGGKIIKIENNKVQKNEFSNHISEVNIANLTNVDIVIENNGTIGDFNKKIRVMIECIEEDHHHHDHDF